MKKFKEYIQYKMDNLFSKSPVYQIALLFILSFFIMLAGGVLVKLLAPSELKGGIATGFWWAFARVMDVAYINDDVKSSVSYFLISLGVTIVGVIILSMIIAVLSAKLEEKLADLQKGKSLVVEANHTLILGWNEKIYKIIEELIIANENKKKAVIVVLADKEKEIMETDISERIDDYKTTAIVCRTGAISDIKSLELVNFQQAKSIIILNSSLVNDNEVIKTVLACVNHPDRPEHKLHITAEVNYSESTEVLKLTGKDELEIIVTENIIPRLAVQIARQTGLSIVYEELLNFAGEEIYMKYFSEITGKKFSDICFNFPAAMPIGIYQTDIDKILINPSPDMILRKEDELILIAEDDDTAVYEANINYARGEEINHTKKFITQTTEKILILGWNNDIYLLLQEMDSYMKKDSLVDIAGKITEDEAQAYLEEKVELKNIKVSYFKKECTRLKIVEELQPFSYHSIILLSSQKELSEAEDLDAETIVTLLILRSIQEKTGNPNNTKIVSEIINSSNKKLAAVTHINDFIISSEIISMLLTQVSEEKHIIKLYDEIFGSEGSEIYIKPVSRYLKGEKEEVNFYQIMERAFLYNEIAIGFLKFLQNNKIEVKLNPTKTEKINFGVNDLIIVFAESYFD